MLLDQPAPPTVPVKLVLTGKKCGTDVELNNESQE
jgi:hypothetical protein